MNWLLTPQVHKSANGYYLNHDNLMLATQQQRQKLIFYFIASQTPEKLMGQDAQLFVQRRDNFITSRQYAITLLAQACVGYVFYKQNPIGTAISRRPLLNLSICALTRTYSLVQNLTQIYYEPIFVDRDEIVAELAAKYNFSVYDFSVAKKESHLKYIRRELVDDSANASHF